MRLKTPAQLIEGTVQKVHNGGNLVGQTDEVFKQAADSSKKVAELVAEIAAASDEQAQGIDQINKAVAEMDKVTQTSAATAEETASASEEMNGQADSMHSYVAKLAYRDSRQGRGAYREQGQKNFGQGKRAGHAARTRPVPGQAAEGD